MSRLCRVVPIVLAVAGLSACSQNTAELASSGEGYPALPAAEMAAVDWSAAETVEIELSAYEFSPSKVSFQAAKPYRLVLTNTGKETHDFVSEGFFKAIVAHEFRSTGGAVANPFMARISVPRGAAKELRFIAVERGSYDLECTVGLHSTFGMNGTIDVE